MPREKNPQGTNLIHFVTLFDCNYASRGLALWRSLERHAKPFKLWVIALDLYTENLIHILNLPSVQVIPLSEIETPELLNAKSERSFSEYCWTLTPFVFDAVFERDTQVHLVTYIDADVWLRQSPARIFADFRSSQGDVFITEHAYHPAFDVTTTSGYFCVQFLGVKRKVATDIVDRWKHQCLEWCFAYPDSGRFGDQGYLNDWPARFGSRVHVPANKEWFQGPWNAIRFPFGEAVAYHFHSFLNRGGGRFSVGSYPIPKPHRKNVYQLYATDLAWAEERILRAGLEIYGKSNLRAVLRALVRRLIRLRQIWTTH